MSNATWLGAIQEIRQTKTRATSAIFIECHSLIQVRLFATSHLERPVLKELQIERKTDRFCEWVPQWYSCPLSSAISGHFDVSRIPETWKFSLLPPLNF